MSSYEIKQGDTIARIASREGMLPEKIWSASANRSKLADSSQDILEPGITIEVPERETTSTPGATEKRHKFRRKTLTTKLLVQLLDEDKPRADLAYILFVDGVSIDGTTDSDGMVEQEIAVDAESARLVIGEEEIVLDIGHMDPAKTRSGQLKRLENLCITVADPTSDTDFSDALRTFQRLHDLEVTGKADQTTIDKLVEVHGC